MRSVDQPGSEWRGEPDREERQRERGGLTRVLLQPGVELRRRAVVVVALHGAEVRPGGVAAHGVDVRIRQGPGEGGGCHRAVGAAAVLKLLARRYRV